MVMPADEAAAPYADDDWQCQLEEVLALQSIFADDFRVTNIPGHKLAGNSSSSNSSAGGGQPRSSFSSSDDLAGTSSAVEEQLQALLGSPPPDAAAIAAAGAGASSSSSSSSSWLTCEAMVHVEVPAGQLQLILASGADDDRQEQQQQQMQATQQPCSNGSANNSNSNSSSGGGSSRNVPFGPPIRFLPPIRLQLSLPRSYPSSKAPALQLQACWLAPGHCAALQQQLQQLWQEQGPGQPVCFTWLEYLKCSALQALGIADQLVLQEQELKQEQEQQEQEQPQQQEQQQVLEQQGQEQCGKQQQMDKQREQQRHRQPNQKQQLQDSREQPQGHKQPAGQQQPAKLPQQQQQQQAKVQPRQQNALRPQLQQNERQQQHQQQQATHQPSFKQPQQQQQLPKQSVKQSLRLQQQQQHPRQQQQHPRQQQQHPRQQQQQQQQQVQGGHKLSVWAAPFVNDAQQQGRQQGQQSQPLQQPLEQPAPQLTRTQQQRLQAVDGHEQQQQSDPLKQPLKQHAHPPQLPRLQHLDAPCDPAAAAAAHDAANTAADSGAGGGPAAAAARPASVEQVAVQLLRYSAAREQQHFNAQTWTCGICFEQVLGAACLRLPDCGHWYCSTCLRSHAGSQLEQGGVENMRCPEPSCRRVMPPYVLKELLGPEGYSRWEELLLQRTLDKMEDVVYCPRCDTVCIEDADHCAQCTSCLYAFCTFCCDSWHPGTECLDPHERLKVLERRKGASTAADRARQLDLANQLMSLKYLDSCSKKCPQCGMATIKNEGCNKMTCVYCRAAWCWKCSQLISGYDHFRESRCNMFEQEEIARWNAMMWANERAREVEMGQIMLQVRGQAPGVRFCRCPVCGQENVREGRNNLLRCWSCTSSFCAACRTWLRGKVGQHYVGRDACKQHSD